MIFDIYICLINQSVIIKVFCFRFVLTTFILYYLEFKNGIKGADAMFFKKAKQIKRLEEKVLRLEKERDETLELALETHMKLQALE
ncbi:hypothetical protein ACTFQ8_24830 [Bacillus cereus group sp. MYBK40-2]|jgi:hypothetical protein|uniref:hypothetical protein n=1 Tax=Bacillus cereus group sp. MYBK40-2 TaxID=3450626 RepID=UPI003F7AB2EB